MRGKVMREGVQVVLRAGDVVIIRERELWAGARGG